MPHTSPTRRQILTAVALAAVWPSALAAQAPRRALSPEDEADVGRVEDYFNAIRTFRARFLQIDPHGGTADGTLYLWRPGRLRVDYDPPNPNLLIANGRHLIHFDRALKAPAYLGLDSTPAGLLVRDPIKLSGDVTVVGVERGPQILRVTVTQTADPRAGRITFVFTERPFQLTSWQVTDGQGQVTRLALDQQQTGISLDPQLFVFRDPNVFGDQGTR